MIPCIVRILCNDLSELEIAYGDRFTINQDKSCPNHGMVVGKEFTAVPPDYQGSSDDGHIYEIVYIDGISALKQKKHTRTQ